MDQSLSDLSALASEGRRRSSRLQATPAARRDSLDISIKSTSVDRSSRSTPAIQSSRSTPEEKPSRNSPREGKDHKEENTTPCKRRRLRRRDELSAAPTEDPTEAAMKPLTDEERRSWQGWVELESDPALFNYILREYGVKGVKVQEVLSLDDEMLGFLPKPVYGLIFLFKYWEEEGEEGEEAPNCPNHVWFANQTITNACATIALLNIVMNVPKLDLGENLGAFKAETNGLKSAYRGQRLGNDDFIRNIHNSFARRMDMLNIDLALQNDVDKWKRSQKAKKKKKARKSQGNKKKTREKEEEDPGFHFIAYVPVNGVVWRLDGLQRQPVNLGDCGEDWITVARDNIYQRIGQYDEDGLQFNLLSLCKSPLRTIPEKIAETMHSMTAVEKALTTVLPDWRQFIDMEEFGLANEPNDSFALSKELISNSYASNSVQKKLKSLDKDPSTLLDLHRELVAERIQLQSLYLEEVALIGQENEQAARRKIDYTPAIYNSIKTLAEQGVLKEIVRDLRENGNKK